MAQHYPEIIGIVLLLVFAATMFYQGTCILRNQRGYSLRDYMKQDSTNMRKRIEEQLSNLLEILEWLLVWLCSLFLFLQIHLVEVLFDDQQLLNSLKF